MYVVYVKYTCTLRTATSIRHMSVKYCTYCTYILQAGIKSRTLQNCTFLSPACCPACVAPLWQAHIEMAIYWMAEDAAPKDALAKLMAENASMEKEIMNLEIMNLTKGGSAGLSATKSMGAAEAKSGIKVLNFGTKGTGDEAGKDLGSSWCPPQCSRRTVLGGFFTS